MGLLDKVKKVVDDSVKKMKYKQKEKEIKEVLLHRFAMWQLERICVAKKISPMVEGKRGKRRAKTKNELVPKLMRLEIKDIIRYAKKFNVKYEDLIEELEEYKKSLGL